jgi:hypothetical protein
MALIKTTKIDKVEFVGEWKTLQVRHLTEVKEGDETLASSYSRDSYEISVGIAGLPAELQPYATGVWTDGLVAEWETKAAELVAKMEAEQASLEETA